MYHIIMIRHSYGAIEYRTNKQKNAVNAFRRRGWLLYYYCTPKYLHLRGNDRRGGGSLVRATSLPPTAPLAASQSSLGQHNKIRAEFVCMYYTMQGVCSIYFFLSDISWGGIWSSRGTLFQRPRLWHDIFFADMIHQQPDQTNNMLNKKKSTLEFATPTAASSQYTPFILLGEFAWRTTAQPSTATPIRRRTPRATLAVCPPIVQ